jgi:glycerate 2-kinase
MMRIVIAPDKFKGSLPAAAVAAAIAAGLRAVCPAAELVTIPVADGGEGTVDAAVAAGFERVPVTAAGPTGDPVQASYARRGEVAVVELAGVCGLARLPGGRHSTLTAAELATAGIAAVYPLSDLEPDLERCRAEAGPLLRRAGQMIAHDRLAAAVTGG